MRDIKELLLILLNEYHAPETLNRLEVNPGYGFTRMITRCKKKGLLSDEEGEQIRLFILEHKPSDVIPLIWWPMQQKQPRIEFLSKLISEL